MNTLLTTLKNRSFFFLWTAEIFSQIAMNMMNFMLTLVVFSLSNSSTAVSGIVLSFTIPAILFAIPAGALVDKWGKKSVLFTTNLIRAVLLIFVAFTHQNLPLLYTLSFVISIVTQFFIPAETPMIPLLVKKQQLFSANALFGAALFGSIMIAYALSGPFLIFFHTQVAFLLLSVFFLLGALSVVGIGRVSKKEKNQQTQVSLPTNLMEEMKNTLSLITKVSTIYHAFALLAISQIIVFIIAVIGPGYAKHILNIDINQFPIFFVVPAMVGVGIGIVLLSTFFRNRNRQKLGTLGLFLTALVLLLMPFGSKVTSRVFVHTLNTFLPTYLQISILHIMAVLACGMGIANAFIFIPSNTLIQEATSDAIRGKVYGALNALISLFSILPVILVGSFADVIGVGNVLIIVGIAIAIIGFARLFIT